MSLLEQLALAVGIVSTVSGVWDAHCSRRDRIADEAKDREIKKLRRRVKRLTKRLARVTGGKGGDELHIVG